MAIPGAPPAAPAATPPVPTFRGTPVANAVWDGQQWTENGQPLTVGPGNQVTAFGQTSLVSGNGGVTPSNPADLQQDPTSGLYFDPKSSQVFQKNPDGSYVVVTEPGVRTQVANNIRTSQYYGGLAKTYNTSLQGTMGQQQNLADAYKRTIEDPNAPSVAREQLNQALQANEATQLSGASGASGANAFIARRNAANNIAGLNAKAGADAAELRAGEVATATKGLADTYNSLATEGAGGATLNTNAGLGYSTLGNAGELGAYANDSNRHNANASAATDIVPKGAAGASGATAPVAGA